MVYREAGQRSAFLCWEFTSSREPFNSQPDGYLLARVSDMNHPENEVFLKRTKLWSALPGRKRQLAHRVRCSSQNEGVLLELTRSASSRGHAYLTRILWGSRRQANLISVFSTTGFSCSILLVSRAAVQFRN